MAFIQCNFHSDTLGLAMMMNVILPQKSANQIGMDSASHAGKHKTLLLLHGMSDDHSIWMRRTSIERYAAKYGIAVVMPSVHRSYYTDMAHGLKFWTFISEELPMLARSFFPLSDRREDNFVAGLSMGGYGAFKLALSHPEKFAAAASLSGALDISRIRSRMAPQEMTNIFGDLDKLAGSNNDLFTLASSLAKSGEAPQLFQCCGTEDFLYEGNIAFRNHAQELGLPLTYEEGPGIHEWGYWDANIQRVLEWLPLGN